MASSILPLTIIIDSTNNYNNNNDGGLILDERINIDNPTSAVIDVEQDNTFLCCPLKFINWNEPHGLLYYNLPWFPKRTSARDWFIDNRNSIRIPDEHKIIPSFLFLFPCVWIHALFICPVMEANSILIYIDNHQLKLKLHQKELFSENIRQLNSESVVVASNIHVKTSHQKEIRLCIILSNGERSIKTQWLPHDAVTSSKLNFLRDTVHNYVNNIENYTVNCDLASSTPTVATSTSNPGRGEYYHIVADAKIITDDTLYDCKEENISHADDCSHLGHQAPIPHLQQTQVIHR